MVFLSETGFVGDVVWSTGLGVKWGGTANFFANCEYLWKWGGVAATVV